MIEYIYKLLDKYNKNIDYDLYKYGITILFDYLIYLSITFIFSLFFNTTNIAFLFILFYSILRKYYGGFHFNSKRLCIISSISLTVLISFFSKSISIHNILFFITYLLQLLFTIFFIPIDHKNKRLNDVEKKYYKKKSIIIEIIFIFIYLFCKIFDFSLICNILFFIGIVNIFNIILSFFQMIIIKNRGDDQK